MKTSAMVGLVFGVTGAWCVVLFLGFYLILVEAPQAWETTTNASGVAFIVCFVIGAILGYILDKKVK